MKRDITFDDALDLALSAVLAGETPEGAVEGFPPYQEELRGLIHQTTVISRSNGYEPPSDRLVDATARVQAAVGTVRRNLHTVEERGPRPSWRWRAVFASMSVPVTVLAFAVGGTGAATATMAINPEIGNDIADQIERATPGWSHRLIPGGEHRPPSAASSTEPSPTAAPALLGSLARTPNAPAPLEQIAVEGAVSHVRGSIFDLASSSRIYIVQTDDQTSVIGDVSEGATVTVVGVLAADNTLHATAVTASAILNSGSSPEQSDVTPQGIGRSGKTPPGVASDATPTMPTDKPEKTKTLGPPEIARSPGTPERTLTPGRPEMTRTPGPRR